MLNFKQLMQSLIIEELHPELQDVVKAKTSGRSKQTQIANKVKELTSRGESTGIEGNMPKGSSRAYLAHKDLHHIEVDGKPQSIKVGTKVAIKAALDRHHNKAAHDGMSLGQLQNHAEGSDHYVNHKYRVLTKDHDHPNKYHSNDEDGIFPPLIDHDHEHHEWSKVGHARDIKKSEFKELTKHKDYPKGISHSDFVEALVRDHDRNHGKDWGDKGEEREEHLDHIESHPLVEKFMNYHRETGNPPHDYHQIKNLGVFEHNGKKHIVARDHGFSHEVSTAYRDARRNQYRHRY